MFKKLDFYILKKFAGTFFLMIFLFILIAVVFDISEKIDDFDQFTIEEIIFDYYFSFIPWLYNLLTPILAFLTVIYFTSRMASKTEIIPILASGISFKRFLRPYLFGGIVLFIISLIILVFLSLNFLNGYREFGFLLKLYSGSLVGNEMSGSIFDTFVSVFVRDFTLIKNIVIDYPLALLVGAGFPIYGVKGLLNPVFTNDTYFLMWITQYGIAGSSLMIFSLIYIYSKGSRLLRFKNIKLSDRLILLTSLRVIVIFIFSTIHSSVMNFYPIYFYFFTFLGISNFYVIHQNDLMSN